MKNLIEQITREGVWRRDNLDMKNLLQQSAQGGGGTPPPDPNPNPNPEPPTPTPDQITVDNITEEQVNELKTKDQRTEAEEKLLNDVVEKEKQTVWEQIKDSEYDSLDDNQKAIYDEMTAPKPNEDEQKVLDEIGEKQWDELTDEQKEVAEKFTDLKPPAPVINQVAEHLGVEIEEGDNIPDTVEGMGILAQKAGQIHAEQQFEKLFNANDEMKKVYEHIVKNGQSLSTLILKETAPDYTKFDITNEDGQKALVEWSLKNTGMADNVIAATLQSIVDQGALEDTAKSTQEREKQLHEKNIADQEAIEKQQLADQQAAIDQQNKQINEVIDSGKIMGLTIPVTERQKFKDFMFSDAIFETAQKLDINQQMFFNYVMFKNFEVVGIEKQKGTQTTLSQQFQQNQQRTPSIKDNKNDDKPDISGKSLKELGVSSIKNMVST